MYLSREKFVKIIESIMKQDERDREISNSLDEIIRGGYGWGPVFSTPLVEEVVSTLDVDGIISWWLWDGPQAGKRADEFHVVVDGKKLSIHNAGELYDYITKEMK